MYGTKCYVIKVVASMYIGVCIKGMSQCRNTHYEEQEQKCEVQSLCSFFWKQKFTNDVFAKPLQGSSAAVHEASLFFAHILGVQ